MHTTFALLPAFLEPGDLVVVNTSATIPAAVDAVAADGTPLVLHLSTAARRRTAGSSSLAVPTGRTTASAGPATAAAAPLSLGDGASADARASRTATRVGSGSPGSTCPQPVLTWLAVHGRPIRYGYVDRPWPLDAYQNVYATEPGSAEMPSAGRPFTPEVITRLVAKGVGVTPLVLHTGVASLEADELPYPERVMVPPYTAARVNATHAAGGRVVAVGTTVVRALETAVGEPRRRRSRSTAGPTSSSRPSAASAPSTAC